MDATAILIVGGYGVVGRRIAAELAVDHPGRVVVAGRDARKADAAAAAIGHAARGRRIDVRSGPSIEDALEDVQLVVSCVDQPGRPLLHAAIARGLSYTDVTPHLTELGRGPAYARIAA